LKIKEGNCVCSFGAWARSEKLEKPKSSLIKKDEKKPKKSLK